MAIHERHDLLTERLDDDTPEDPEDEVDEPNPTALGPPKSELDAIRYGAKRLDHF